MPPVLVTLVATLVNPYGPDLLSFLLRTATVPRPEIADWQPLPLVSLAGLAYLVVIAIAVVALLFSQRQKNWILLVLFGIAALLPWISIRHLPLFCIAFLVLIGEHVGSAWISRSGDVPSNRQHPRWLGVMPLIAAIVVLVIGLLLSRGRIEIERNSSLPTAAMQFLKASGVEGNLATHFDWGEYLLWHLGPGIKVSIDGRRETVYSNDVYRQNYDFNFGANQWDALLTEYPTDLALVMKGYASDNLLRLQPDWLLIYEDEGSALFVKRVGVQPHS